MKYKKIMVTGGAGFIGSHLVDKLLDAECEVLCLDDFNDYYNPALKRQNVQQHLANPAYRLVEGDIRDKEAKELIKEWMPEVIVHLAARAGVRPSLSQVELYQTTNVAGTLNLLEAAREAGVKKFIFGSSSSVYGLNKKVPFSETDPLLKPASPYAATKIAGEALCHTYAHLYDIHIVALRFFTVYGPRQRPDLAIRKFAERMLQGEEIVLFGDGSSARDYTYIDDIIRGVIAAIEYEGDKYEIFNLGNSSPVQLKDLVAAIEKVLGVEAKVRRIGDQPGDVPITYADITRSKEKLGYNPTVSLEEGLKIFIQWLRGKRIV
ncbi:MAG: GDP-mannose 4,6-dehydratase [Firmicutes bacterium]|nr:GDP-mannose 4,6-dehydratase [Bacillota bacterium]